ncbi:dipeptidase [Microvirga thermotolerans]|uniref:Peptidase n=1 Tax=Microvirga thermotolerans TaxID=2651334 RepID=A0A5P9JYY9_9HYPH|nr:dipeptidase [Microvirga thermotolerans]QFU17469.1 peptidase [Microvirga thermotolerans]
MSRSSPMPVFDGHNDVLLRLMRGKMQPERAFLEGDNLGHLDWPRMKEGGFAGGFFAVYVPSEGGGVDVDALMTRPQYDVPLPEPLRLEPSQQVTVHMAALLLRIERASKGEVKVCRTAADIRECMKRGALAAILHIEGAEGIDPDLYMLDVLYQAGLRSLGPVWSRPNIFGHGVPFRYPSSPDTGPGLTDLGKELIRACNRLKIMLDLSHLNEKGFWDVAKLTDAPLVATHSNAHAICPHSRNLTDRQLAAIRESRGMVGVNFATSFIRADGQRSDQTTLEEMIRHMDHLIEHVGVDGVGMGSDFDGATIPAEIGDARGLPRLVEAMRRHGYDEATLRKLCYENWIDVLERTWGA